MNVQELKNKIQAKMDDPNGDVMEATLWFIACHEATQMHDMNTIKDWARILLNGISPIQTDEDIKDWLDDLMECCEDDDNDEDEDFETTIDNLLNDHFGE